MVPVVCVDDGRWLLTAPLKLMMKPGGHGAIWKLMHDEGMQPVAIPTAIEQAVFAKGCFVYAGTLELSVPVLFLLNCV